MLPQSSMDMVDVGRVAFGWSSVRLVQLANDVSASMVWGLVSELTQQTEQCSTCEHGMDLCVDGRVHANLAGHEG